MQDAFKDLCQRIAEVVLQLPALHQKPTGNLLNPQLFCAWFGADGRLMNLLSPIAVLFRSPFPQETMLHIQQLAANYLIPVLVYFSLVLFTSEMQPTGALVPRSLFIHHWDLHRFLGLTHSQQSTKSGWMELIIKLRAFLRCLAPSTCDKLSHFCATRQRLWRVG